MLPPRAFAQQNACPGNQQNCAGQIADKQAPRNPRRRQFLQRDSEGSRRVQKVLDAIKYRGDRDQHADYGYQHASHWPAALLSQGGSRKNPASAPSVGSHHD
jgi:hypothetical protein